MSKTPKGPPDWYRLDNAGVLYSALQREKYSPVYRFSAVLSQPVDPAVLQRAVDRTMPRFPGFRVRMKPGVFWHYFEPNDSPGPFVRPDMSNPCQPIRFREDNGWLVRFFYYQSRISLEVFHAVSDGAGALTFFRTLLAVYLRELGHPIPCGPGLLDVDDPPRPEELEDAYARYAGKRVLRDRWQETAFSNTSQAEPFYTLNVTMGFLPVDRLKEIAARYGASITEYLSAVLLQSILENQEVQRPRRPRPAALAIPIDLRGWFPSATLRNFILTVRLCVDPTLGPYTFPELVRYVHHYMRLHINPQEMRARFTGNVHFTANRFLQLIPIFLKNPVMSLSYQLVGVRPFSATYTNPGLFRVPPEMAPHIQRMEVVLGQATRPSLTAPPSAMAIPWLSPSPAPAPPARRSGAFSPTWYGKASPSRWSPTGPAEVPGRCSVCPIVSTAAWSWIPPPPSAPSAAPRWSTPGSRWTPALLPLPHRTAGGAPRL